MACLVNGVPALSESQSDDMNMLMILRLLRTRPLSVLTHGMFGSAGQTTPTTAPVRVVTAGVSGDASLPQACNVLAHASNPPTKRARAAGPHPPPMTRDMSTSSNDDQRPTYQQ